MRFPVMLTKENDKQVKELNNTIRKWIDRYEKEKNENEFMKKDIKMYKVILGAANNDKKHLINEIIELKRQLKNKDKGIEATKDMLQERTTDEE